MLGYLLCLGKGVTLAMEAKGAKGGKAAQAGKVSSQAAQEVKAGRVGQVVLWVVAQGQQVLAVYLEQKALLAPSVLLD